MATTARAMIRHRPCRRRAQTLLAHTNMVRRVAASGDDREVRLQTVERLLERPGVPHDVFGCACVGGRVVPHAEERAGAPGALAG
jgi:hypothetical protein